jgi:putative Mg2+ transporter-C (MgtC) family protein
MDIGIFIWNIGAALVMGAAIGAERQMRIHTAGLRTNALVSLGAGLFVSLSLLLNRDDPTRVAAQIVSGIGFLGGGVILREGFNVKGMNTAATLWCSAAVGTLAGMGFVKAAAIGTAAILVTNLVLRPVADRLAPAPLATEGAVVYRAHVICDQANEAAVRAVFLRFVTAQSKMDIRSLKTQKAEEEGKTDVVAEIVSTGPNDHAMNEVVSHMCVESNVASVRWERLNGGNQP